MKDKIFDKKSIYQNINEERSVSNINLTLSYRQSGKKAKLIFFIIIISTFLCLLTAFPRLSIPLILAYIIGLILEQTTPPLTKIGFSKTLAISIIFLVLVLLLSYPIGKIIPLVTQEIDRIQYYIPKIDNFIRTYYLDLKLKIQEKVGLEIGDGHLQNLLIYLTVQSKNLLLNLPNYLAIIFEWLFLIPIFLFFILKDGRQARFAFFKLVPNSIFERSYYLWSQFNKQLGEYIFAKFIEATIIGFITTVGLVILQVPFAFLLGAAAALTNIIPYVGPIIGVIPAIIVSAVEHGPFSSVTTAVIVLYFTANLIDIVFVFPILVSKIVDMHPILVIVSIILGSQYMGIVGMIVSIPLAAMAKLIFVEIYKDIYNSSSIQAFDEYGGSPDN